MIALKEGERMAEKNIGGTGSHENDADDDAVYG